MGIHNQPETNGESPPGVSASKRLGNSGRQRMIRKRNSTGRFVRQLIVFLLLCGIAGGEIPELLKLTDNTANDFAVRKTDSVISPLLRGGNRHVRVADAGPSSAMRDILFPRFDTFEEASLVSSAALILDTVLRT